MSPEEISIIKSRIEAKHQGDNNQLEVIFSPDKRLLVEAPAGYGKTHTMVSRIAYLIAIGQIPVPKRLLALTFSVNAAYKIKKDVSKNIPELLDGFDKQINIKDKTYISNYHGFCRSVLKKYGHILHPALSKLDTLQSVDDSRSDNIMRTFKNISINDADVLSNYNSAVREIKGTYLRENINRYNSVVIAEILQKEAIPFNAIITLTIKLFQEYPSILSFYQNYYTTILVDEFQDTNLLSYWLLNYLISEKSNVLFLGDSLQRIYGFIGAVPNLLSRAQSYFKLKLISLDKNYRFASNENMLQLDKIIRQNAFTPFQNPSALSSKVEFNIYEDQVKEALEVVIKSQEIQRQYPTSKVAILAKQRGPNIEHIIKTFDHNKISFFYGLFTDDDPEYLQFNRKCLYIAGIIALRGDFIGIIDFKRFLGDINSSKELTVNDFKTNNIILLENTDYQIGILVDKIFGIETIPDEHTIKGSSAQNNKYVLREVFMNDEIYTVLNMETIFSDEKLFIEEN